MTNDHSIPDLVSANFVRGQLADAEQRAIKGEFAGFVSDVLYRINDGKEATVWLCSGPPPDARLYAAKMYRARKFRAFRNDAEYAGERPIRDRRMAKAMRQRTRKGARESHIRWVSQEWDMLVRLHAAGIAVPEPLAHSDAGVLMSFIGDADGAAPRLADTRLPTENAAALWTQLCGDIAQMLRSGVVHGDLSAYNVLLFRGRLVFIDLPQAISTSASDAYAHFARDLRNLARWFERAGVDTDCERLIDTLWRSA